MLVLYSHRYSYCRVFLSNKDSILYFNKLTITILKSQDIQLIAHISLMRNKYIHNTLHDGKLPD